MGVFSESSIVTKIKDHESMRRILIVSLTCTLSKYFENSHPLPNPIKTPNIIDTGMFTNCIADTPFPCMTLIKVVNKTITYTSSTEAPAKIN